MNSKHDYERTYEEINGRPAPTLVTLRESSADILSPGRGFMGGFDLTMQPQVGCPGG